jgi:hypothetical protein
MGCGRRSWVVCCSRPRPATTGRGFGSVLGWYAVVALWDVSRGIAVWLTLQLTATPVQWLLIPLGCVPAESQAQVHLFTGPELGAARARCAGWPADPARTLAPGNQRAQIPPRLLGIGGMSMITMPAGQWSAALTGHVISD